MPTIVSPATQVAGCHALQICSAWQPEHRAAGRPSSAGARVGAVLRTADQRLNHPSSFLSITSNARSMSSKAEVWPDVAS